jgi:23S rRNA pseudouridine1911/1915/1917 synthase
VHEDRDVLVIDKPAGWWCIRERGIRGTRCKMPCWAWIPAGGAAARRHHPSARQGHQRPAGGGAHAEAHTSLTRQLMARTVSREYLAVCVGVMTGGGTIDEPIGRHRSDRLRMAVRADGRPAVTHYRVLERFRAHTYLSVKLETGRTHQIRLHLSHLKYPIVGDPVYGGRFALPRGATRGADRDTLRAFKRQALHAATLAFDHPRSGKRLTVQSPLPRGFRATARGARRCARGGGRDDE